ncbi:hypothetical protein LCGC14_0768510 [marine sediment metagenome]|uniref:Uncharacterized protein n=1 Tax=marine sediment metagenome TaxID=412755 RepID=A0A0F9T5W8_9ZZZZ
MTTTKKSTSILGRAMLVNVWIGLWSARKHDAEVTDKVNTEMAKNDRAGRYHKRLFGGDAPSHSMLVNATQVARVTHYKHTLPWEDAGWRLLPTANYFEYVEAMRTVQTRYETALEKFLRDYPTLVRTAEERLGQMYKRSDYPTTSQVRTKFHFTIQYGPVPSGDDFRVTLPKEQLKAMTRGVEDRVKQAVADAMGDVWQRLGDTVTDLRTKLGDGKYLRPTMIARVGEMAEIIGRLNLTGDAKLEKARKQVLLDLSTLDVESLRDDEKFRKDTARKADAILASMKGVYTPPKKKPAKKGA